MALASESDIVAALEKVAPDLAALDEVVRASGEPLEGNLLYMHQSFEPNPKNQAKQQNLYSLARALPAEDAVIVEIGFNAGHSCLLMLAAHPTARIVVFDLCEHSYTLRCFEVLSVAYPGRLELLRGRSQQTVPERLCSSRLRADLFHIDGDHSPAGARTDLQNCALLARPGAQVVFDDVCFSPLKAIWTELHDAGLLKQTSFQMCPTNRHGVAVYSRPPPKTNNSLMWDISPALEHRGRMRHVLVLAPIDHGQDSLLGYLAKRRPWDGRAPKSLKLMPNATQRHQSPWLSVPLRYQRPDDTVPVLVHLVAPPFDNKKEIADCFPLVDGVLAIVDCAEGLTQEFKTNLSEAARRGLQPVLLLNKLDKLLRLEHSDESCYQLLSRIVDEVNELLLQASHPRVCSISVGDGSVVFGRGSLSVADSIGGWGFRLDEMLGVHASRKDWTLEQVARLKPRLWGDHFYDGRRWGQCGDRGFCAMVLRPIREALVSLESEEPEGTRKLTELGIAPLEGTIGNARKHSAMEAWLPLADVLLDAVVKRVPPPADATDGVFYAARCVRSVTGGSFFACGRRVATAPDIRIIPEDTAGLWLLNLQNAVALPLGHEFGSALLGMEVGDPFDGPVIIRA
jgi:predicted O-methyltransferase YrrM